MRRLVVASALFSVLVAGPIAYMAADNLPPYEYNTSVSYLRPSVVEPGGQTQVLLHWSYKHVNRICRGVTKRHIVDVETGTVEVTYDPIPTASDAEVEDDHLDRTFLLPPLSPGQKLYYADLEFWCNPLQRLYPLRVRTPKLPFEVRSRTTD